MSANFATAAARASRQNGRVAWRQLVAAGINRHSIQRWLRGATDPQVPRGVGPPPRRPSGDRCLYRAQPDEEGASRLRLALGGDVILSELECAFPELLRAHGLPSPRTNIDHLGDKVDCRWAALDVTVELLRYRFHATRRAILDTRPETADAARGRASLPAGPAP